MCLTTFKLAYWQLDIKVLVPLRRLRSNWMIIKKTKNSYNLKITCWIVVLKIHIKDQHQILFFLTPKEISSF
jgi:hypothetical protein